MCISDVYKSPSLGLAIAGKIESGIVGVTDNVFSSFFLFQPILAIPFFHSQKIYKTYHHTLAINHSWI